MMNETKEISESEIDTKDFKKMLNSHEKDVLVEMGTDVLKSHYNNKYDIFELNDIISMLQKTGIKNQSIAKKIGIREDKLYYITPIRNATLTTKSLIKEGKIEGYKAGRLLRTIGQDKRQNEFIKYVIENDLSLPKAESWITSQKRKDNEQWRKEKKKITFSRWIEEGVNILTTTKDEELELNAETKRKLKIINVRIEKLMGNGI